jgi:ABC-type Mn2+/Zn2+ transport system ATPase subunit
MITPSDQDAGNALLVCDALSVHFENRSALSDIQVAFRQGETVSLVGPNGAGKSTLLRVLAGMLPATHGSVTLNGEPVVGPTHGVTYVPQRTSVDWTFPVSVLDVVLMARANRRTRVRPYISADREAALEALDRTGMRRFAQVQIGQLSGGQQQRVFLARALLQDGRVYLLDEPFAGVDIPTQELLVTLFEGLRQSGRTIIYATHDLTQAARSSDRVLLLNRTLIAAGRPESVMTADNLRATFGGAAIIPFEIGSDQRPSRPS